MVQVAIAEAMNSTILPVSNFVKAKISSQTENKSAGGKVEIYAFNIVGIWATN